MANRHKQMGALGGGIFFIGLAILILVDSISFWPWILAVIGVATLPSSLAANKGWYGWNGFIWLVGLAVLFHFNIFWPGILLLIGGSLLVSGIYGTKKRHDEHVEAHVNINGKEYHVNRDSDD